LLSDANLARLIHTGEERAPSNGRNIHPGLPPQDEGS